MARGAEGESDTEEVVRRIDQGEGQDTEFKEDFPDTARDLAKEMAAFATSNEGHIILGVDDDGNIVGLARSEGLTDAAWRDEVQQRIQGIAGMVSPRIRVGVKFIDVKGKTACDVFVPKGDEPSYYVGGVPYLRDVTVSRRAEPEEVKEFHRKHFVTALAAPVSGPRELAELLNQLADLDLILSDTEKRYGDDLEQWRYDLEATAEILRRLSATPSVESLGAHDEIVNLASALLDLRDFRLYIDGGVTWRKLLALGEEARKKGEKLSQRVMKRISLTRTQVAELGQTTGLTIRLLREEWQQIGEPLHPGRLSTFRSEIRRLAFLFGRAGLLFRVGMQPQPADLAGEIAILLRSVDRIEIFHPGIGRNPVELMRDSMVRALALGDDLEAKLGRTNSSTKGDGR